MEFELIYNCLANATRNRATRRKIGWGCVRRHVRLRGLSIGEKIHPQKRRFAAGGTKRRRFVRGSGSMGFVAVLVILWDSVTTASASFGIEKDGEGSVKWREVVLLKVARLIASDIW